MVELISEPKVGLAFTYGRKSLPAALREHWWIYCIIALVGALLTAQSATSTSFKTSGVDALAIFPALAVATRLATPEFRLTARIFSRLLGFYFLFVVCCAAVVVAVIFTAKIIPIVALVLFPMFVTGFWLAVKISLVAPFYALRNGQEAFFDAVRESMDFVSMDIWWTVVGLTICIGLCCMLIPGILADAIFLNFRESGTFGAAFIAALVAFSGSIPCYVWTEISLVALATTAKPRYSAPEVLPAL
jgi:hypothetical protein